MYKGRVKPNTGLNLRDKPNGDKTQVIAYNESVEILDEVTFFRVKTQAGKVGYVHGDYLEKIPPEQPFDYPAGDSVPWSPEFKVVNYANPYFVGEAINVDRDFVHELDKIADFAKQSNVKVWVTSSMRQPNNQINGAIVKPVSKSCHHIGHAIDMNLLYKGMLYNSKKLRKSNHHQLPQSIMAFIQFVRDDSTLRWGGDFLEEDPVHIDDNLYNSDSILYQAKLNDRIDYLNA